jgi:NAD+ synthase
VFDGGSFVLDASGEFRVQAPSWRTAVVETTWRRSGETFRCDAGAIEPRPDGLEAIYYAMMVGLRDYVTKNRFPGVILGLSGGIDSALTAVAAVDALGAENVWCVMMPSPFTSQASLEDAAEVARLLGVRLDTIAIEPAMAAFGEMLKDVFAGRAPDTTEENIQARSRAVVLMALSNKFGHMLLTTGNKSEMSVGYATLYGDMSGGFSVLKDVYKTTVFALSRWRNQFRPDGALGPAGRVIPERVISKPPSAELKDNQTDQDSLPPYDELDAILGCLIEREASVAEIAALGYDEATIKRVWRMVDRAEYKRRQAPPGVKITYRAFGRDRRYPITNQFTDQI